MSPETKYITTPDPKVLTAMTGSFLGPYQAGDEKNIYLVDQERSGGGVIGITDLSSNRRWLGWFEHFVTNARVGTFLAQELKVAGVDIDSQLVLDGILAVHVGRIIYEGAKAYPNLVRNSDTIINTGADATEVGRRILQAHGVRPEVIEFARMNATDADEVLDDITQIEHRVGLYADYRVTTRVVPLLDRIQGLRASNRVTPERADELKTWSLEVEREIFGRLPYSPENITDDFPPQPLWERVLRQGYIQDIERPAFDRIRQLEGNLSQLNQEFPSDSWWGSTLRCLYDRQDGIPTREPCGTHRAIALLSRLR